MGFELVTSYLPLVVGRLDGTPTEAEADAFRAGMDAILNRSKRFGQLLDLRHWSPEKPEQRKQHSEWTNRNREAIKELSVGAAFVVPSILARVALNFIFFFSPMPAEHKLFESIPDAVKWLEGQFKQEGLQFPEEARPYLKALEATEGSDAYPGESVAM